MNISLLIWLIFFAVIQARPSSKNGEKMKCGYESCHPTKEGVLNVHLVPHSHDDVGWLKTVDQYYYGSRTNIQRAGVQYIIDSVIDELLKDEDRRFVYVETAFFEQWWNEQHEERKHDVMRLVHHGQLEFAGGAWSMNDEATTHYHSVLDQLTWGLRVLNDTFGKCAIPKVGWQIDPFGHSRELSSIFAQAGYDGIFVARIDYQDKARRLKQKEMEMLLRGSDDIGAESDLLYGVLYNHYSAPPGFCFDILCNDDPLIDDPLSFDNNVNAMVEKFVAFVKRQADSYKTNHVIVTMGDDFNYQDAHMNFKNMDKLIKYVNEKEPSVRIIYSTPGCYLKSLHESNTKWPTKQDDFFPYSHNEHSFWTGYFTSRPTIKYFERRGNNMLQACKQLYSMTKLDDRKETDLLDMRHAMGIMQHHDAVTGTEKQHVANDYSRLLEIGMQECLNVSSEAINKLMSPKVKLTMKLCKLNETDCETTEKSTKFVVTLYNSLSREVDYNVRLPVNGKNYEVKDGKGLVLKSEIIPTKKNMLKSSATGELYFRAIAIPALGYKSYYIQESEMSNYIRKDNDVDELMISGDFLTVKMDEETGHVDIIELHNNGKITSVPLHQEILYYEGMAGDNSAADKKASGAYIFRPNGTDAKSFEKPENTIFKGERVEEIHQKFSDWATQVIRLYKEEKYVEFEWTVGPIPITDKIGKEVISRFTTEFKSNGVFYTDSNGRQLLKRIRDKRPTWDVDLKEPIAGNYYPVTSMIGLKDDASKKEFYILTDRVQGGASLKDGQMELMVHRRLLYDDALGVGEALNETIDGVGIIVKGTHYLFLRDEGFTDVSAVAKSRMMAMDKLLQPIVFVSPAEDITYEEWKQNRNEFSGVHDLPPNVHILTLEPWKGKSILLRLENYFQKDDHPSFNEVTVDLEKLFSGMKILSMRETTLAANQWKDEAVKLGWKTSNEMLPNFNEAYSSKSKLFWNNQQNIQSEKSRGKRGGKHEKKWKEDNFKITLGPMEIKTLVINVEFTS